MFEIRFMKAMMMSHYGNPTVLCYGDTAIPTVQTDEILVQIAYAGVSPFDAHVRAGWFKNSSNYKLPIILGWELSGTVVGVGKKVKKAILCGGPASVPITAKLQIEGLRYAIENQFSSEYISLSILPWLYGRRFSHSQL